MKVQGLDNIGVKALAQVQSSVLHVYLDVAIPPKNFKEKNPQNTERIEMSSVLIYLLMQPALILSSAVGAWNG